MKKRDLTSGGITGNLLLFALPMMAGNLMQQIYNLADTLIVGRFIGPDALAAVGSAYTLMIFITSVVIGLCMGSGAIFAEDEGAGEHKKRASDTWLSLVFIMTVTAIIYGIIIPGTDVILKLLQIPQSIYDTMRQYTFIIFIGVGFTALYNFCAFLLRSVGNSAVPLYFLASASLMNIVLDLVFVVSLNLGVKGAAAATVISQAVAGIGLAVFTWCKVPYVRFGKEDMKFNASRFLYIVKTDFFTGIQQSVMNFGILMIQGLVNTFGPVIMAAFAAAVKIDTIAYMPAQEFGNAYSLFISQNYGAGKKERIERGTARAIALSFVFCAVVSVIVWIFAGNMMSIFVKQDALELPQIINEGVKYLHIEGACYFGIGILFLLYGLYRGIGKPQMSLVLTIISLGTRVFLAYTLAPGVNGLGVCAIWAAIPVGWVLADITGIVYYLVNVRKNNGLKMKQISLER